MEHNISFFMPAYNCENTVEQSIDSIMQTNFVDGDELVIVNDCSTDQTTDVLTKCQKKYPQIKVINNQRNKGGAATRNIAIENTKHELLFCLDSDNILEKNSIAHLKAYLIETEADVASFQSWHYFSKSIEEIDYTWTLDPGFLPKKKTLSTDLLPGASGNYLFTKKSWNNAGGYPEFAGALDTWGFGVRQLLTNAKVMVLENSYYYHRLLPESYFVRDAWSRRKSIPLRAVQILIPFFDQIDEADINYMLGERNRYKWFENINKRPIAIVEKKKNQIFALDNSSSETKISLSRLINYFKRKLK